MNQMKFPTNSQNAHELGANVTGMKMAKKLTNFFFEFRKTTRISKHNKIFVVDDKEITEKTHILEHII